MDLRALDCFVAVADELHFRKAAARLNITQPALSMRIQALEREVGVALLARDRRSVKLTEAGRAFLEPARAAVRNGAQATTQARRAARGETGDLRFGFTALTSYAGMPQLVQGFRLACPDVRIDLVQAETNRLEAALLAGEIDIALLHPPLAGTGLTLKPLKPEPLVLAIPTAHRLARLRTVPLQKLAGEPFLMAPRAIGPNLHDQIIEACRQAGFSPNVVQDVTAMTTLIGLVAAGAGCGFVISSLQVIQRPGMVFRPLTGKAPRLATALAWRDGALSAAAVRLVEMAGKMSTLLSAG